ncbi:MAG: AAA family ATPase [Chloroflexi bacterium]|nr:AAA family ATPase [Chloroflexota bacterium]MCI0579448.1 AAA family ATPase [Chloroflexota bacterium]MCI0644995.1 AAA family ATPase [Chloroflexota bacterium]MCI0732185.1 AAA family ATPase [Chloroflexota bacterium]
MNRNDATLTLRLLGPLAVERRPGDPRPLPGRKTGALLAYLAATGRAHPRQALMDLFCQESDDPARALRWQLSAIRRHLGPQVIITNGHTVQFNAQTSRVDSLEFERTFGGELDGQPLAALAEAARQYRGDFLAGLTLNGAPEFELWLLGERARLRQLYEHGLSHLVARCLARPDYETAIHWAQRLVQSNPLLEEAHARLVWLYAQTGQRPAALAQYEQCRDLLERELAVAPAPELTALYQSILDGHGFQPVPAVALAASSNVQDLRRSADFVGRDAELAQLRRLWQAAGREQGRVVLVEAEAGGGKSRLVQELASDVTPAWALIGHCYESTRTLPYHPWFQLLQQAVSRLDEAALDRFSPFWLAELTRLLPSLAVRLGMAPRTLPTTSNDLERLFSAVGHFLSFLAGETAAPVLIFIDDLQWADDISLRLFHAVARRAPEMAVLLIGAFRSEEAEESPALATLLHDLPRTALPGDTLLHLKLAPLAETSVLALAAQLWPGLVEGYRPHVCALLARATGGNPLFLTEVLRELAYTTEAPAEVPVPASVHDLVRRRLRQLPPSGRQVIEAIAILDMSFTLNQAWQTSGRSEDETVNAIDLGLRWRLLEPQAGDQPARYDFSHALMREGVIQQVSDVRRQLLHRRAAATLAQSAGRLPPAQRHELAGRITRHAAAGEDFRRVLAWAPAAAEHACSLFAYADALAAWQLAVNALDRLQQEGDVDAKMAGEQRLSFLLRQVELLALLGRWSEEAPLLAAAAGLLEHYPDRQLQAAFHLRQAVYGHDVCHYEPALANAQQAYQEYLALEDQAGAARALYEIARIKMSLAQNVETRPLLEQALALYRAIGDTNGEASCLSYLAASMLEGGEVGAELHQVLARSRQIAEEQRDLHGLARACYVTAMAWNFTCHVPPTRAFAQETLRLARELGDEVLMDRANFVLANCYILEKNVAQAWALDEQLFAGARARRDGWQEGWAAHMLGRLALVEGDLTGAEQWLKYAFQVRQERGEAQNHVTDLAWMGRLSLAQENVSAGVTYTTEAVRQLEALTGVYLWDTADIYFCHAEALTAAGRPEEAHIAVQRAYEELTRSVEKIPDPAARQSFLSFLHYARIVAAYQSGVVRPYPA